MRGRLAALAATGLALALLVPAASASAATAIHVQPGQSIQAAIDGAPAGSVIEIAPGTYAGNLEIARSMHLVGDHAVIVPAAVPADTLCQTPGFFDGDVGICAHGVPNADFTAITPIPDVSFEGITVRDFSGPGIVALGVDGLEVARVVTAHNGEMGMFINSVSSLSLRDSRSYDNRGDGYFLENLPEGSPSTNAVVSGNASYGNLGSGIMFINSLGGRITGNSLHGNCAGIMVAGFYGEYGVAGGDVLVRQNRATANNRWCPADGDGAPDYGGIGIALVGSQNTTVERNDVHGNRARAGSAIPGGGIVIATLVENLPLNPASNSPTGNAILNNRTVGNGPYDIFGDGSGSGNTASGNSCRRTNLGGC